MTIDERARRAATALREQADDLDTDALLERVQRARRPWGVVIPAVVAGSAVVIGAVVLAPRILDSPVVEDTPPLGSSPTAPAEPADPDAAPNAGWQRVTGEGAAAFMGDGLEDVTDVAANGARVVAFGEVDGAGTGWLSFDGGRTWERLSSDQTSLGGDDPAKINDVTAFRDGFVAVGYAGSGRDNVHPVTLSSADGETWARSDLFPEGAEMVAVVAAGSERVVAAGWSADAPPDDATATPRGAVWSSRDGRTWSAATIVSEGQTADVRLGDIAAGPGGFVATDAISPVAYVSSDGGTWEAFDVVPRDRLVGAVVLDGVTAIGSGYLIHGFSRYDVAGSADMASLWESSDGTSWAAAERPPGTPPGPAAQDPREVSSRVHDIEQMPSGTIVAGGSEGLREPHMARAWMGDEGGSWEQVDDEALDGVAGRVNDLVVVSTEVHNANGRLRRHDHIVASGIVFTDEGFDGAVWTYGAPATAVEPRPTATPTATPPSPAPTSTEQCSARDATADPPRGDLPNAVRETRERILEAAIDCDYDALEELARAGAQGPLDESFSAPDPGEFWRFMEGSGTAVFGPLVDALQQRPRLAVADCADCASYYTWQTVDWQTGITEDGDWLFFAAVFPLASCQPHDLDTQQPGVPGPVGDTWRNVLDAAAGCNFEALGRLASQGDDAFSHTFGAGDDPVEYWRSLDAEGTDIAGILETVLLLEHATKETQLEPDEYETIYVWPSAARDEPTQDDWQAVVDSGLYTAGQVEQMEEFGGYTGWRVGIAEDGEWLFFIAGD